VSDRLAILVIVWTRADAHYLRNGDGLSIANPKFMIRSSLGMTNYH